MPVICMMHRQSSRLQRKDEVKYIMRLERVQTSDVLVLGSGIAGVSAALEAAETGCSVTLACAGNLFSGSSFYPGTWGLGLIGPADEADCADLAATIRTVGCGMTDPSVVDAFVKGIHPAIEKVKAMGVKLRRADHSAQKEFIPCFDHKHRDWNGIEFDSAREVFSGRLKQLGVNVISRCEALQLVKQEDRVCGAVVAQNGNLAYLGCRALILATGGYGSIFQYHLCTEDVSGLGQALALDAGCELVNMEFMQMMPGYLSPAFQTVFNEKTFRFTEMTYPNGTPLLSDAQKELLVQRSTYGPFTSRLPSKEIDYAIFSAFQRDETGVVVQYSEEMKQNPPEFVQTYFEWLKNARGVTMDEPIHIGIFAHAANGGVRIATDASTGVPGLFAAGEVTGGMHGADRIGGLSTANGLVFGGIAGRTAAEYCVGKPNAPQNVEFVATGVPDYKDALSALRKIMFKEGMVVRTETGLRTALEKVQEIRAAAPEASAVDCAAITRARRLRGQLCTAECILNAALLRRESRGPHFRADFPGENTELTRQIVIRKSNDSLDVHFDRGQV